MNEHWAPQSELCGLHALRFDFVGRYADMRRETLSLGSLLGLDATPPEGASYGWQGNNASRLLEHFYGGGRGRALIGRIGRLFAADVNAPLNGIAFSPRDVFR